MRIINKNTLLYLPSSLSYSLSCPPMPPMPDPFTLHSPPVSILPSIVAAHLDKVCRCKEGVRHKLAPLRHLWAIYGPSSTLGLGVRLALGWRGGLKGRCDRD